MVLPLSLRVYVSVALDYYECGCSPSWLLGGRGCV
jgi:hypothetical protein